MAEPNISGLLQNTNWLPQVPAWHRWAFLSVCCSIICLQQIGICFMYLSRKIASFTATTKRREWKVEDGNCVWPQAFLEPGPLPWLAMGVPPASEKYCAAGSLVIRTFECGDSESVALGCRNIHVVHTEPPTCHAESSVCRSDSTFSKQESDVGFLNPVRPVTGYLLKLKAHLRFVSVP